MFRPDAAGHPSVTGPLTHAHAPADWDNVGHQLPSRSPLWDMAGTRGPGENPDTRRTCGLRADSGPGRDSAALFLIIVIPK